MTRKADGGTLARFSSAGHAVTIIYLTREKLAFLKSHGDAADIRTNEALEACKYSAQNPFLRDRLMETV
jgi:LmbE family N-acetylglucosaminyl deacetylase